MTVLFILLVIFVIYAGNAPVRDVKRESHEMFRRTQENCRKRDTEEAKKYDYFYDGGGLLSIGLNRNFYGDGSLRKDGFTGKRYEKGVYYVNSRGYDAAHRYDPDETKRPI